MTGYGKSRLAAGESGPDSVQGQGWTYAWEIKSVNSRHLDIKWRTPVFLRSLETEWERVVREYGRRGRLDIFLHLRIVDPALTGVTLNCSQAAAMLTELKAFALDQGKILDPDYNRLLSLPYLWEDDQREPDPEMAASLEQGLRQALKDWNKSRAQEGQAMAADLSKRLIRLEEWVARIRERAPEVKEQKAQVMRERILNFLESASLQAEPDRLLQEAAVLSDKLDISEELTRLAAHLDRLSEILENGGEAGKRLDFTLQECFREINTCGNKAQDSHISRLVVDFKAELEKCREQVQNLE